MNLPPTDSAGEHTKRARLQVKWRAAGKDTPPTTSLSLLGWSVKDNVPVPVYGCTEITLKSVLQYTACACGCKWFPARARISSRTIISSVKVMKNAPMTK